MRVFWTVAGDTVGGGVKVLLQQHSGGVSGLSAFSSRNGCIPIWMRRQQSISSAWTVCVRVQSLIISSMHPSLPCSGVQRRFRFCCTSPQYAGKLFSARLPHVFSLYSVCTSTASVSATHNPRFAILAALQRTLPTDDAFFSLHSVYDITPFPCFNNISPSYQVLRCAPHSSPNTHHTLHTDFHRLLASSPRPPLAYFVDTSGRKL